MKQKIKKIFENAVWWSGVVMVGLILGASLQFVRAWTEPAAAPPGGNVGAPVNTSLLDQAKAGGLGVLSLLTHGFQMPEGATPGAVLTAQADLVADPLGTISTGKAAWAAGTGGGGGSYEVYGTRDCGPLGYTDVYGGTGVAASMYILENSAGWKLSGGGSTICKSGGDFTESLSGLFIYWGTYLNHASRDKLIQCALCVK